MRRRPAAAATARGTYTEWWWPPSPTIYRTTRAGYQSFELALRVEVDPGPGTGFLWAHEFSILGGNGGYVGVETPVGGTSGGSGKVAVFSIREALRALGDGASTTTDPGAATCRVPLPSDVGRAYALRIWTERAGWWSAAVRADSSDREIVIGGIVVPDDWRRLGSLSVARTEYRGTPLRRCEDLPVCSVAYEVPTADGGRVQPERNENRVGPGTCEGSQVEAAPGGVRHAIGRPS